SGSRRSRCGWLRRSCCPRAGSSPGSRGWGCSPGEARGSRSPSSEPVIRRRPAALKRAERQQGEAVIRLTLAIVLALLAQLACAQPDAPAGTVSLVEGDVRFLDAKQQLRRPRAGDAVYEGDSIVTGSDGEVHLEMQDGGYIGVRPGTRMRILEFKAE